MEGHTLARNQIAELREEEMKHPLRKVLLGFFGIVGLLSIALYSSPVIRDWFESTFVLSEVKNPRPTPAGFRVSSDTTEPVLRFFAIGDAGTGGFGQQQVAESMGKTAEEDSVSFVLYLGDNFYESGVSTPDDEQWKTKFEEIYSARSLGIPFFAVLGNHDYRGNPQAQVEYAAKSSRWKMPARYYTFSRAVDESTTVQFFCLDSDPITRQDEEELRAGKSDRSTTAQLRWFERALAASKARWKFAMAHHPLYSSGMHGNNLEMISAVEPLLERYHVDFFLAGHDHDLELLKPVKAVNHVVTGAAGKHRSISWSDSTIFAATNLGYTMFTVSHTRTALQFYNREGRLLYTHLFEKPWTPKPARSPQRKRQ